MEKKICPSCMGSGYIDFVFGERLRREREKAGYTQEAFAMLIGLSRTQITNIELGRSQPTTTTIITAARILNVSSDELLGITKE